MGEGIFDVILNGNKELFNNIPQNISEETKKKLGNKFDKCIALFSRFHPDSKLR